MIVRPGMGQGGADRVTLLLLQHLDPAHFDVSLVLMRKAGEHLHAIPSRVNVIDCGASNLFFFLFPLWMEIKKHKPDVLFSTCGGANMPLALIAFFHPFRKWKVILSERNVLFHPGKSKIKRWLMYLVKVMFYRFADVVTVVSLRLIQEVQRSLFLKRKKIMLVDNPVIDADMIALAKEKPLHPWFSADRNVPVVLHVGRFVHQKDHRTLVKSFQLLRSKMPARLFLLGEGPLQASIKSLVNEYGLKDDVYFAGFDINPFQYMSNCDLFVLSSVHEGMPGVLIQAMACGAPVISTDCPSGPDEVITHPGQNGYLVQVGHAVELAEKMSAVLSMPEHQRRQMGHEGSKAVQRFYLAPAIQSYVSAINYD